MQTWEIKFIAVSKAAAVQRFSEFSGSAPQFVADAAAAVLAALPAGDGERVSVNVNGDTGDAHGSVYIQINTTSASVTE